MVCSLEFEGNHSPFSVVVNAIHSNNNLFLIRLLLLGFVGFEECLISKKPLKLI